MTRQEIVQALHICGEDHPCRDCQLYGKISCVETLCKQALDLIERLTAENSELREKVTQWISVEDRLPEPGVPVLVNYIGTDELPHADGVVAWTDWGALWWEGSLADSESEVTVPITHWMPLPEAPGG
nr:MAG TPA: Protein of unknown function (DUF551) [Bacteriophage sp.]